MIRALFLDAAGTLIDLAEPVGSVYTRILGQHGIQTTPEEMSQAFRRAFGSLPAPDFSGPEDGHEIERRWWRDLVHHALGQEIPSVAFDALFDHYADPAAWTLFPEVPEFLDRARQAGLKLAVVSNFDRRLHPILEGLGLTGHFDLVVSSADARARKPDPAIFHHTLRALDLSADQVLHIGDDARLDHAAALACGLQAFHVDRPKLNLLDAIR
ncbi:MAG: HAD-IA family hydrolase [Akkermansiaceae bacterium]|nr:HAD-IA family hydrolase [Akkermansiaceae bacterium]